MADLYSVHLEDHARLSEVLQPFIPQSLIILGALEHASDPAGLRVWSSYPFNQDPPALFAIFMSRPMQGQIFCSAEVNDGHATTEEEAFLVAFLQESLRVARELARIEHQFGAVTDSSPLLVGSIHEKWTQCLRPLSSHFNPCMKFLLSPDHSSEFAHGLRNTVLPQGTRIGPLEDDDLDLVIANSHIPRKRSYLQERSSHSICIRMPVQVEMAPFFGDTMDSTIPHVEQQPVAWCLVHADGSFGSMHVIDSCQRRGLGTEAMRQLVALQLRSGDVERPTRGWHWVDVACSNHQGVGFYGGLACWKEGWVCSWMIMSLPPA